MGDLFGSEEEEEEVEEGEEVKQVVGEAIPDLPVVDPVLIILDEEALSFPMFLQFPWHLGTKLTILSLKAKEIPR